MRAFNVHLFAPLLSIIRLTLFNYSPRPFHIIVARATPMRRSSAFSPHFFSRKFWESEKNVSLQQNAGAKRHALIH
jgi:hypothetical protein